jgi:pyrroline-5-carboxylate reductase
MNKILLIGCGHMGSALLKSWTSQTKNFFFITDPINYKKINNQYKDNAKVKAFSSIDKIEKIFLFDIIIFAVQPQILKNILEDIMNYKFNKKTIFVSIVAGKKINFFNKFLKQSNQFIRVMPNMPAMINEGMSCLVCNKNVLSKNKNKIENLFSNVGKTLWLKNELEINKVTAISGSGPGYIFLFIDAFEKAALQLGLGKVETKILIHQTFLGSIKLLLKDKSSAESLAKNIAVKGGTTEAGLKEFTKNDILYQKFKKVIKSAYLRANQLGK